MRYVGNIRDMFTKLQMHNDEAPLTGAGHTYLLLDGLPVEVLEQVHTANLTGKSDQEMIECISKAGRTTEKWEEANKHLSTRTPRTSEKTLAQPMNNFRVQMNFKQKERKQFKKNKFVNPEGKTRMKTFAMQIEGVHQE